MKTCIAAASFLTLTNAEVGRGFPFMRMFGAVGVSTFACYDPINADNWFDPKDLTGHWI